MRIKKLIPNDWNSLNDMQIVYAGGRVPDSLPEDYTWVQSILHINYRQPVDVMRIYFLGFGSNEIVSVDMSKDEFFQYIEAPFIVLPD